jgi:hypothetical protein
MKKFLLLAGVLALAGMGLLLAEVKTDYNHSVDFSRYKTYSWLKVDAGNSLWVDRIKRAVDMDLAAKGWMMVPSGGDASISAFGATKTQPSMQTFYDGLGGGWGWRGFGGEGIATTTVTNQEIGTLTVDMFDSQTKMLIWRGTSTRTLSDNPDKNEKTLEKSTAEMFKKFPPNPKG